MRIAAILLSALALTACTWDKQAQQRDDGYFDRWRLPQTPVDRSTAASARTQVAGLCGPLGEEAVRDGQTPGDYRCRTKDEHELERRRNQPPW